VWSEPTAERLVALLHEDVVLYQPHLPPIRGRDAACREFRKLFRWLPGLHGEVERYSGSGGVVFIEWELKVPVGRRRLSLPAVDRFRLDGELGIERTVYFDQLRLIAIVALHPRLWPGYWRYRFGSA
jgi:hypothetical protein